jgi:hypothetical protein
MVEEIENKELNFQKANGSWNTERNRKILMENFNLKARKQGNRFKFEANKKIADASTILNRVGQLIENSKRKSKDIVDSVMDDFKRMNINSRVADYIEFIDFMNVKKLPFRSVGRGQYTLEHGQRKLFESFGEQDINDYLTALVLITKKRYGLKDTDKILIKANDFETMLSSKGSMTPMNSGLIRLKDFKTKAPDLVYKLGNHFKYEDVIFEMIP